MESDLTDLPCFHFPAVSIGGHGLGKLFVHFGSHVTLKMSCKI